MIVGPCVPQIARATVSPVASTRSGSRSPVVLSHYHAVRVLGASAYQGAEIIASNATRDLILERGRQHMDSEIGRFP